MCAVAGGFDGGGLVGPYSVILSLISVDRFRGNIGVVRSRWRDQPEVAGGVLPIKEFTAFGAWKVGIDGVTIVS